MGEYTGGEILAKALKREGVRYVFGISGHGIIALLEALRKEDGIDFFSTRHEENAAHMADGWARSTGRIGVCCSTVGSGVANLASGLYEAYADSSPVLAVTASAQSAISYPFVGALEDLDSLSLYRPITKWNAAVHQWSRIPELVQKAFREALTGRPGPVHLDIPLDILFQKEEAAELAVPERYRPSGRLRGDQGLTDKAARLLLEAERPLLVAGGGVIASEAWKEFQSLADCLGAAATCTPMGSGSVSSHHSRFFGDGGWLGGNAVMRALQEADVILAVGCQFTSWLGLGKPPVMQPRPQQKIIHIDIDPTQLGKKVPIDIGIAGDAKAVLADLLLAVNEYGGKRRTDGAWVKGLVETYRDYLKSLEGMLGGEAGPITMGRLAKEVGEYLANKEAMVTIDGGMVFHWAFTYLHAYGPRCRFFFAGGGHLGCGHPYANAIKLAFPDRPVVNFCGDGAFGLTLQELDTAVRHKLPVVHVVNNDGGWGMCKAGAWALYGEKANDGIDQDFSPADYAEIAKGFGCYGERVINPRYIKPALERAFKSGKPGVLNVATQLVPHPMFGVMAQVVFQGVPLSMPGGPPPEV
ncbi:MAG: thiamine pyrophosphate-binding protein [Deltaproteobacteria bacterium]|nr:thiamine pyrophosphate-binding protein [Deltaproteobacteria bacterium]